MSPTPIATCEIHGTKLKVVSHAKQGQTVVLRTLPCPQCSPPTAAVGAQIRRGPLKPDPRMRPLE